MVSGAIALGGPTALSGFTALGGSIVLGGLIVLSGVIISLSTRACLADLSGGTATELGDGIVTHFCTFTVAVSILDVPSSSLDVSSGLGVGVGERVISSFPAVSPLSCWNS